MPVALTLAGVFAGLASVVAGLIAGLPLPALFALYLGGGSLSVLLAGAVVLTRAARAPDGESTGQR
jgi:hypothetical protein